MSLWKATEKQGMPQGMPAATWRFPPRASRAVPMPSDQSLGHAGSPCPASWQGAGYRQVCVATKPSDSVCAWCYKADSLPCHLISLSFPGCKRFLRLHPKPPAFRSSHSFASLLRSCLGLSARLMLQHCQEFDLQLLPGPFVHVGTERGAEKVGKR